MSQHQGGSHLAGSKPRKDKNPQGRHSTAPAVPTDDARLRREKEESAAPVSQQSSSAVSAAAGTPASNMAARLRALETAFAEGRRAAPLPVSIPAEVSVEPAAAAPVSEAVSEPPEPAHVPEEVHKSAAPAPVSPESDASIPAKETEPGVRAMLRPDNNALRAAMLSLMSERKKKAKASPAPSTEEKPSAAAAEQDNEASAPVVKTEPAEVINPAAVESEPLEKSTPVSVDPVEVSAPETEPTEAADVPEAATPDATAGKASDIAETPIEPEIPAKAEKTNEPEAAAESEPTAEAEITVPAQANPPVPAETTETAESPAPAKAEKPHKGSKMWGRGRLSGRSAKDVESTPLSEPLWVQHPALPKKPRLPKTDREKTKPEKPKKEKSPDRPNPVKAAEAGLKTAAGVVRQEMPHIETKRSDGRPRLFVRIALAACMLLALALVATPINNKHSTDNEEAEVLTERQIEHSDWADAETAYILGSDAEPTVPFYSESLSLLRRCGRGTELQIESWTPYVSEDGTEYYHVLIDSEPGYIETGYITDNSSDLLQETEVYVRSSVNLLQTPGDTAIGSLAEKGTALRVTGYDYFDDSGQVHMYQVKLGEETGWINADYVAPTYAEALENWTNDSGSYKSHVSRGDSYGGGDAADLDYYPHEKGDFADEGNEMPESVYALYIPATASSPESVQTYLDYAEGTEVNAIVFTLFDEGEMAYDSPTIQEYGLSSGYYIENTVEEFAESIQMAKDAGYYVIGRITTFKDSALASTYPEWAICDLAGNPQSIDSSYWPSVYSRDVWQEKVSLAVEAVDLFGINEIQFDYVRFPDYIINYEEAGSVDLKNTYGESKAQAVQRFLTYACDVLHAHGAYVAADVFGESSNTYVAPYGQYWPAISTVVDVICGMPYPDHYDSYWSNGEYYRPYKHPYTTLYEWSQRVTLRQAECSSPAIVRTWLQTWSDADYQYDQTAIAREIVGLYDADITGGFMFWHSLGSLAISDNIGDTIDYDWYSLYQEAVENDKLLSEYMNIDTEGA